MAYEIGYSIDQRVIFVRVYGDYTYEDAHDSNVTAIELIRSGVGPVHIIIDSHEMGSFKIGLSQLRETITMFREPNIGWIIAIGVNPMIRFIGSMVMQMGHVNFRFVENMNDALDTLQRVDLTLRKAN